MDFWLAVPSRIIPLVLLVAFSGAVSAGLLPTLQSQVLVRPHKDNAISTISAYRLDMKITNIKFTESLNDPNSQDYKTLQSEITEVFHNCYGCSDCDTESTYEGVSEMTFRNGSVIVSSVLLFNTLQINEMVVKGLLSNFLQESPPKGLDIDENINDHLVSTPETAMTTIHPSRTTPFLSTHTAPDIRNGTTHSHLHPTVTKLTSDVTNSRAPLSHVTNRENSSSTTRSRNSTSYITITTSRTSSQIKISVSTPLLNTTHFTNNTSKLPATTRMALSTTIPLRNVTSSNPRYPSSDTTGKRTSGSHNGSVSSSPRPPVSHTSALPNATSKLPTIPTQHTKGPASPKPNTTSIYSTSRHSESHSTMHITVSTKMPSSHNHSIIVTHPTREPQTTGFKKAATAPSSTEGGGVPGWGIALLVLASVILLVLIVILILALWHWCCRREEPGFVYVNGQPNPYAKAKQLSMGPDIILKEPGVEDLDNPENPKKNRTGFYAVNPE